MCLRLFICFAHSAGVTGAKKMDDRLLGEIYETGSSFEIGIEFSIFFATLPKKSKKFGPFLSHLNT